MFPGSAPEVSGPQLTELVGGSEGGLEELLGQRRVGVGVAEHVVRLRRARVKRHDAATCATTNKFPLVQTRISIHVQTT